MRSMMKLGIGLGTIVAALFAAVPAEATAIDCRVVALVATHDTVAAPSAVQLAAVHSDVAIVIIRDPCGGGIPIPGGCTTTFAFAQTGDTLSFGGAQAGDTVTFGFDQAGDTIAYPFNILSQGPFDATDTFFVATAGNTLTYGFATAGNGLVYGFATLGNGLDFVNCVV